jgi:hypothetical protein
MRYLQQAEEFLRTPLSKCPLCKNPLATAPPIGEYCSTSDCIVEDATQVVALALLIDKCAQEEARAHKERHQDFLRRYQDGGR